MNGFFLCKIIIYTNTSLLISFKASQTCLHSRTEWNNIKTNTNKQSTNKWYRKYRSIAVVASLLWRYMQIHSNKKSMISQTKPVILDVATVSIYKSTTYSQMYNYIQLSCNQIKIFLLLIKKKTWYSCTIFKVDVFFSLVC